MTAWPAGAGVLIAAAALSAGSPAVAEPPQESTPRRAESSEPPAAHPSGVPSETPIADSIEPAVERFVRERLAPCGAARGVPCFPVTLEIEGRRYSVQESLETLEFDSRPAPGPPTAADMIQQGANPHPTSASVAFDPKTIVCKTRQLIRKIQGRSRAYYLYRVWDETGERAVLRDRPLDPEAAAALSLEYVPLGEFGDECQAIKAYLASTHRIRARKESQGPQPLPGPGLELRTGDDPE